MCFILKKDKQKALKLLKQKINGEIKITYREIANISNYSLSQIKRFSQDIKKIITQSGVYEGRSVIIASGLVHKKLNFIELFDDFSQPYVVVTFLSVLEMAKNREINIKQDNNFSDIYLERVD